MADTKRPRQDLDDDDTEYNGNAAHSDEEEGAVKCTPCNTTAENYDQETDTGGTMIQCDKCSTWQHTRCMGFKGSMKIPDYFECDQCNPTLFERRKSSPISNGKKVEKSKFSFLKEAHRISTAKAFKDFFELSFPENYNYPENLDSNSLASKWAMEIESIIYNDFPKANYNSESRRILFLVKKKFINDLIEGNLTLKELAHKTPEEINKNILEIKQQLKDNIKNIVLVQADEQHIIRRTHKGEEVREDYNEQPDEIDQSIITKSVDHRRFSDHEDTKPVIISTMRQNSVQNTYFHSDDEDEVIEGEEVKEIVNNKELKNEELKNALTKEDSKESGSESSELEPINDQPNEDVFHSFTGEVKQEQIVSPQVWSGRLTFPDYATFEAKGQLYLTTNSRDTNTNIDISKDILYRHAYEVEGRLDRDKADQYLNAITKSRDLFLVEVIAESKDYQKLYDYLLIKNKVGVLTGKPTFVKDSYLIPVDFRDAQLPGYLKKLRKGLQIGLFALYVVRKDYLPTKNSNKSDLDEIMNQLNGN